MGRKLRIEYEGAVYHIIQRGNNKEFIFARTADKQYLIEQMNQVVQVDGVQIFAYVVMDNHYHIALRTQDKPISKVMHRMNSRYSHYFNKERSRSGHVFEGRYKAIPVENEKYLLSVIRYIHRNPVRAQICTKVSDYKWSSDKLYRSREISFVDTGLLLNMLAKESRKAFEEYNILMGMEDDYSWKDKNCVGSSKFAAQFETQKPVVNRLSLEDILLGTGANNEECMLIKGGSKQRRVLLIKQQYVQVATEQGYTLNEIGGYIGISGVAAGKILQRAKQG